MRRWFALLFVLPGLAQAAGEGAWQDSNIGITLNHRGVAVSSRPLTASQPVQGMTTRVVWRYALNGPVPAGLRVRLCSLSRCTELDGQSGSTLAFSQVSAAEPFRFIWEVPGGGRLIPALRVQSIQIIVNYR
ncbi:MAG: flagellar protein FlhE [Kluyvera ascorbata]